MKKWTVEFKMDLYATFQGIEAETEEEAKEIAADMLLDDPSQYLDFSDPSQFDVYEDDEDGE